MKTLINKHNPAIRITAPEIEGAAVYGVNCRTLHSSQLCLFRDDWTLVEERPEFEHRRKDTIYFLETAKTHYADTSELEKCIEWLKGLQPTKGIRENLEEIPSMELILSGLKDSFIENKNIVDYDDSNPFISIYWEDFVRAIKKILI